MSLDDALTLRALWQHMTPAQQRAFWYLRVLGYTTAEYGALFGVAPKTGEVLVAHGITRMRKAWQQEEQAHGQ